MLNMETVNIQSAVDRLKEMIQSKIANLHAESCGLTGGKGFLQVSFMQSSSHSNGECIYLSYEIRQSNGQLMQSGFPNTLCACPSTYGKIGARMEETPAPGVYAPFIFSCQHVVGFSHHEAESMVMALTHDLSMSPSVLLWNRAAIEICARTYAVVQSSIDDVSSNTLTYSGIINPA